jgi:hypothetical protein
LADIIEDILRRDVETIETPVTDNYEAVAEPEPQVKGREGKAKKEATY